MSTLFSRKVVIPLWLVVVFGLFVLFGSPLTLATGVLLLFVGVVPPAIVLILSKAPPLTLSEGIAEELRPVARSRTE